MNLRDAKKLHNRDEVQVRVDGKWEQGYVLGTPRLIDKNLFLPVQTKTHGYIHEINHKDVK